MHFSTDFRLRVSDINYGGHLGNDRVLSLFHEARVRWLAEHGWSEADIEGTGMVQTEAYIRYRNQAFLGDSLTCSLSLGELKSRGFTLQYTLTRKRTETLIADGYTVMRFFDYKAQTISRTPQRFLELFK